MKRFLCLLLMLTISLCGCAPAVTKEEEKNAYTPSQPVINTAESGTDEEILANRRDIVEAEMRRMMSMYWTPAEDITYSLNASSMGIELDKTMAPDKVISLKAGRIYRGMPYSHGSGSGYSFLTYATGQDENGVYTISGLDGESLTGGTGTRDFGRSRISNDCADAVFWAWAQVSSSITFEATQFMTEPYGCIKVGDYDCNIIKFIGSTKPVCRENGEQRMYAAYAQLQKGDAMVLYTDSSGGHAVMITDVHVEQTDGVIDGAKSYVTILEQISSNLSGELSYFDETLGQEVYLSCGVDTQWSFESIFSKGYLPITCKELVDPTAREEEQLTDSVETPSLETMLTGTLESNYRISSVTVTITDAKGKTVQQATCFGRQSEMYSFHVGRLANPQEQEVLNGAVDPEALSSGAYHCTMICRLSTGREIPFRDFDFKI